MPQNITFRTQLLGSVTEFCRGIGIPVLNDSLNLVDLIVLLARYQEEGKRLAPRIYITNDMDTICSMLPGGELIKIGQTTSDSAGIRESIKKCAPLATGGWLVYLLSAFGEIEYGLFRGSSNPLSVLIDDVIMPNADELRVVKAFQIAGDCVEVRANNGKFHYVFLDHREEDTPPPLQYLDRLVSIVLERAHEQVREPATSFLTRLLFDSLRQSHGCILAVTDRKIAPKFLSGDGVILEKPVDFPKLILDCKSDPESRSCIESKGSLLNGMLNSDGVVLFDTRGRLLGYNCFVGMDKKSSLIGGARKRAFETLKGRIGSGLRAVFMQSQDGWSDFCENCND